MTDSLWYRLDVIKKLFYLDWKMYLHKLLQRVKYDQILLIDNKIANM